MFICSSLKNINISNIEQLAASSQQNQVINSIRTCIRDTPLKKLVSYRCALHLQLFLSHLEEIIFVSDDLVLYFKILLLVN